MLRVRRRCRSGPETKAKTGVGRKIGADVAVAVAVDVVTTKVERKAPKVSSRTLAMVTRKTEWRSKRKLIPDNKVSSSTSEVNTEGAANPANSRTATKSARPSIRKTRAARRLARSQVSTAGRAAVVAAVGGDVVGAEVRISSRHPVKAVVKVEFPTAFKAHLRALRARRAEIRRLLPAAQLRRNIRAIVNATDTAACVPRNTKGSVPTAVRATRSTVARAKRPNARRRRCSPAC